MRLVFIGASRFGLKCLKTAQKTPECEICGIITNKSTFTISYSPHGVKNVLFEDMASYAEGIEVPCYIMQEKMSEANLIASINEWAPDFILVVGWYHMVPKTIRDKVPLGVAGIHASLLPKYSGGAPLVWAMINGEKETGLTLFYFGDGVDDGDIIGQKKVAINHMDTIASLYEKIEHQGVKLLRDMLPRIANGTAPRIKQYEEERTIYPQRSPEDGLIDWNWSASRIYNFIRAQTKPYPGAFSSVLGTTVRIWNSEILGKDNGNEPPGTILNLDKNSMRFVVATGSGAILINNIDAENNLSELYEKIMSTIKNGTKVKFSHGRNN